MIACQKRSRLYLERLNTGEICVKKSNQIRSLAIDESNRRKTQKENPLKTFKMIYLYSSRFGRLIVDLYFSRNTIDHTAMKFSPKNFFTDSQNP